MDFETRSACSIRACGTWRYSLDPTTEILCLAFRLPQWPKGRTGLWHPAFPHLDIPETDGEELEDLVALFKWLRKGGIIEAHNAWFERGIWTNICVPQYGWPVIRPEQWRCSAAKAAAHSLPRSLELAGEALRLTVRKDEEGSAIMKKMVKPRNPNKADWVAWGRKNAPCRKCAGTGRMLSLKKDGTPTKKGSRCDWCDGAGYDVKAPLPPMPILYYESKELFERLWAYCRQDVLAEEALSEMLPDLSDEETAIYLLDQAINERGFELDAEAIDVALELIDNEFVELNAELAELTSGAVTKATQRAKMIEWLAGQGLELEDTQADTIEAILDGTSPDPTHQQLTPVVKRTLEIMQALGKSSTAKVVAMRNWICPDNRVHGGLLYHGASTGRWTGSGVQPHNFPRGSVADQDLLWYLLKSRDRELIVDSLPVLFGKENAA